MCVKHLTQSDKYRTIATINSYDILRAYSLRDTVLNALHVFALLNLK